MDPVYHTAHIHVYTHSASFTVLVVWHTTACAHEHTHTRTRTQAHTHIHTNTHTHDKRACTHVYARTHACTHTLHTITQKYIFTARNHMVAESTPSTYMYSSGWYKCCTASKQPATAAKQQQKQTLNRKIINAEWGFS